MAAYLIAITPGIQQSLEDKRSDDLAREQTLQAAESLMEEHTQGGAREAIDIAEATAVFELICTFCHTPEQVEKNPPETELEVYALLNRMINRGMRADAGELKMIASYLDETYVN